MLKLKHSLLFIATLVAASTVGCAHQPPAPQLSVSFQSVLKPWAGPMVTLDIPLPPVRERTVAGPTAEQLQLRATETKILTNTKGRLDRQALRFAMEAKQCAIRAGMTSPQNDRLTIIDYTLPSDQKRLWIVDTTTGNVVWEDWVAHGSGSGGLKAERFSNTPDSHMSSLGLIEPMFEFEASSGRAVRLKGLEKGINDRIYDREIIVHPSKYIGQGKTGRSQGCQAVTYESIDPVVNGLKGGLLYAYHETKTAELASKLIGCGAVLTPDELVCKTTSGVVKQAQPFQGNPAWPTATAVAWDLAPSTTSWVASR